HETALKNFLSVSELALDREMAATYSGWKPRSWHQLNVLGQRAPNRPQLRWVDRVLFVWLYRCCPRILDAITIVRPETVVRWHRMGLPIGDGSPVRSEAARGSPGGYAPSVQQALSARSGGGLAAAWARGVQAGSAGEPGELLESLRHARPERAENGAF